MRRPANLSKPHLVDRCQQREIYVDGDFNKFFDELAKWMSTCVSSRSINPADGLPYRREYDLLNEPSTVSDIRAIFDYARIRPSKYIVRAEYRWGRLNNGSWFVSGVNFSIRTLLLPPPPPDPPDKKPEHGFPRRENDFSKDIDHGQVLVDRVKSAAADEARKDAKLKDNPVEAPSGKDLFDAFKDVVKGGEIPGLDLAKMAVGSWFQAVLNNDAGKVVRVRMYAYAWFIEGFLQEIVESYVAKPPTSPFERRHFENGRRAGQGLTPLQKYQIKLALMYYASENTSGYGGWAFPKSQEWRYPTDYRRYWDDPRILARGLAEQLYRSKYSVD